jgi:hypothetical protein
MVVIYILGSGFSDYNHIIATAGKVPANTSNLIWNDWDVSEDAIMKIFQTMDFNITLQDYDRFLYMNLSMWTSIFMKYTPLFQNLGIFICSRSCDRMGTEQT